MELRGREAALVRQLRFLRDPAILSECGDPAEFATRATEKERRLEDIRHRISNLTTSHACLCCGAELKDCESDVGPTCFRHSASFPCNRHRFKSSGLGGGEAAIIRRAEARPPSPKQLIAEAA